MGTAMTDDTNGSPFFDYRIAISRVIDGDTVVAEIDLGFHVHIKEALRLFGINAPEMRGEERERGKAATAHFKELAAKFKSHRIRTIKDKTGKYGRYLAVIYGEGEDGELVNLNMQMVKDGHAVEKNYG
jgi:micrococcal nuclease